MARYMAAVYGLGGSQTFQFSQFLQLPSSGVLLLKCRLGMWVAPTTNFTCELPFL